MSEKQEKAIIQRIHTYPSLMLSQMVLTERITVLKRGIVATAQLMMRKNPEIIFMVMDKHYEVFYIACIYNTVIMTTKSRHRGTMSIIGYNFKASAQFIEQMGIKYHILVNVIYYFSAASRASGNFSGSSDFGIW